ncbi:glycosyltransferase family 4 protein [Brevibacterium casei]|uniref:glycosyltransferase family 4 protein n=1 Tax=Brevibacterium casei TaxID=33889 RepID=UPI00223B954A|nr:glycosyltransferase family 4 protein [Brevibacterium casei]MCT1549638.1 glycosyltransferase family 4 protein [Brevibacterium casei]MCT1559175.1 glycosyltransferase family 4 protein [Brevibacterium casei]MCT2207603.1 glycosyltransferase family 4 protein [Brevibacterium casei]
MKILFVVEKYPPVVGGGETHVQQVASDLVNLGHDVSVVTERLLSQTGLEKYRDGSDGVRVVEIDGLVEACQSLGFSRGLQSLHKVLSSTDADIIHVFNYVPAMMVSLIRSAVTVPLVVSLFETHVPEVRVFDHYEDYSLERSLQRSLADNLRPDLMICGSHAYIKWAEDGGFSVPTRLVEFGTDLTRFKVDSRTRQRERTRYGWDGEVVFLAPARPVPRKRLEDAIRALAQLPQVPSSRLVLTAPVGRTSEPYAESLNELADCLGVSDRVSWLTGLSWVDMPALYAACDAVVLPSSHEGWGIALNEGMAAGRPVITTDIEGHDEVVRDGETGYLYPPGDIDGLTARMVQVLTADESQVRQIAIRGMAEAQMRFDRKQVAARHADAYAWVRSTVGQTHPEQMWA